MPARTKKYISPIQKSYYKMRRKEENNRNKRNGSGIYARRWWQYYEDVAVLLHKKSDKELGELLGRSTSSIQHRRNRLRHTERFHKIYGRYMSDDEYLTHNDEKYSYQENLAIITKSKPFTQIAKDRGCTVSAVNNHRRKLLSQNKYWIDYAKEHNIPIILER